MSELNKIFDVKSREARRKILDNYPISANDKNEILNKIGSSGGEEGGNKTTKYYKFRNNLNVGDPYTTQSLLAPIFAFNCFTVKCITKEDKLVISPPNNYYTEFQRHVSGVIAFSFTPGIVASGAIDYERDTVAKYCSNLEDVSNFLTEINLPNSFSFLTEFKEITEEEYINLDLFTFNIHDNESFLYSIQKNSTWKDFVNSKESEQQYIIKSNKVYYADFEMYVVNESNVAVKPDDIITDKNYYMLSQ